MMGTSGKRGGEREEEERLTKETREFVIERERGRERENCVMNNENERSSPCTALL